MGENTGKFPGPYLNTTNENDPIMKRVPADTLDIGARKSGLPKGPHSEATISHVGDAASGRGSK